MYTDNCCFDAVADGTSRVTLAANFGAGALVEISMAPVAKTIAVKTLLLTIIKIVIILP